MEETQFILISYFFLVYMFMDKFIRTRSILPLVNENSPIQILFWF